MAKPLSDREASSHSPTVSEHSSFIKQPRWLPRLLHLLLSLIVAAGVLYIAAFGAGPLPPLGSALNVGTGIWTAANTAKPGPRETLHFRDLHAPVTVIFEANGTPHIRASTDDDLFWTIGYLQARFRLTQMDLIRRQGEGRLSEILGPEALSSDEFQVMLGLDRAAQRDWQALPANVHQVLAIYTQGVNALIQEEEQNNSLLFLFKLLNYRPQPWTPIDSLVIQGELTQTGAFSTIPLNYALMVKALGYQRTFSGASIPGFPVTPIGRNQHISWSLTDVQNQSTFFYVEHTDPAHPQQYYWNGAWRQMQHLTYTIPVKGQPPVRQEVYLTAHGPIFPAGQGIAGETLSVDWMGALPSTDGEALLEILKATSFSQFRSALSLWTAPTQNFVYADDQGNIGMISPGYYPVVKSGAPWLPLPGTGKSDILGSIPYNAIPLIYDPPDHLVFSANQQPVANNYPYYIGTTWNFFDDGYRADEIYAELTSKQQLTVQDMERMQNSTHDYLASLIVPDLLKTLQKASLSSSEQQAKALLQSWNENMDVTSPAASIRWTFWTHYMADTFELWWQTYNVPSTAHPDLAVQPGQTSLDEDLETWTLHDQNNAAFSLPNGTKRDASAVMLQAFHESIRELSNTLGNDPAQWQWGKLHTREITSLLGAEALSYGPRASGGDDSTLNAAGGSLMSLSDPVLMPSVHGPSWRMIVDRGSGQTEGVYPGGQDENPASPWYENQVARWWNGQYYPMIEGAAARKQPGSVIWRIGN